MIYPFGATCSQCARRRASTMLCSPPSSFLFVSSLASSYFPLYSSFSSSSSSPSSSTSSSSSSSTVAATHVAEFLKVRRHIVVLTGAGVSTDSGIPDYRGLNGSYKKGHKPMIHADFMTMEIMRRRYCNSVSIFSLFSFRPLLLTTSFLHLLFA